MHDILCVLPRLWLDWDAFYIKPRKFFSKERGVFASSRTLVRNERHRKDNQGLQRHVSIAQRD
jgi:hypothetical protein